MSLSTQNQKGGGAHSQSDCAKRSGKFEEIPISRTVPCIFSCLTLVQYDGLLCIQEQW